MYRGSDKPGNFKQLGRLRVPANIWPSVRGDEKWWKIAENIDEIERIRCGPSSQMSDAFHGMPLHERLKALRTKFSFDIEALKTQKKLEKSTSNVIRNNVDGSDCMLIRKKPKLTLCSLEVMLALPDRVGGFALLSMPSCGQSIARIFFRSIGLPVVETKELPETHANPEVINMLIRKGFILLSHSLKYLPADCIKLYCSLSKTYNTFWNSRGIFKELSAKEKIIFLEQVWYAFGQDEQRIYLPDGWYVSDFLMYALYERLTTMSALTCPNSEESKTQDSSHNNIIP